MKKTYKAPSGKPEDNVMYFNLKLNEKTQTLELDYHFLGKHIKGSDLAFDDAKSKLLEVEKDIKQYSKTPWLRCFTDKIYIETLHSFSVFYYSNNSKEIIDNHESSYADPVDAMERFKVNKELSLKALKYEGNRCCL